MDAHAERRVVTCLFIDVVGSTDLIAGLGPEKMRRRLGVAFEEMSARIEEHGGTVEKFVGDAIFAMERALGVSDDRFVRKLIAVGHPSDAARAPRQPAGQARLPLDQLTTWR